MTNDKVNEVLRGIVETLRARGHVEPKRLTADRQLGSDESCLAPPDADTALAHIHALALAGIELPASKLEKKFRWLGFIQGVLWAHGIANIEELKRSNMPNEEKPNVG